MKKLLCLIGLAMLLSNLRAQSTELTPYFIGDRIDDIPLKNIINYRDSAAPLSSFGDKLIILDFWATWCTTCILKFPLEDSLQALFPKDIQFILITEESKAKVNQFLEKYNSAHVKPLSLPIVTNDKIFGKMFSYRFIPHYIWLAPNGLIMAETSDYFITKENIVNTLIPIRIEEDRLHKIKNSDFNLYMQKPSKELLQIISSIQN